MNHESSTPTLVPSPAPSPAGDAPVTPPAPSSTVVPPPPPPSAPLGSPPATSGTGASASPYGTTPPPVTWPTYDGGAMSHSRGPIVVLGGIVTLVTALVIGGVASFTMRDTNEKVDDAVSAVIDSLADATPPAADPPAAPAAEVPAVQIPAVQTPAVSEPAVSVPAPDEPAAEPIAEAPDAGEPVVDEPVVADAASVDLLRGGVADVVDEVRVARGAETLRILEMSIYEGYAAVQVQNPTAPAEIDEYRWNGAVGSPAPVRLVGDGDLEANLFDQGEVAWDAIAPLVEAAPGLVGLSDGVVTHVNVRRDLPFSDQVRMRVFVSSERANGFVDADAAGNVTSVFAG